MSKHHAIKPVAAIRLVHETSLVQFAIYVREEAWSLFINILLFYADVMHRLGVVDIKKL